MSVYIALARQAGWELTMTSKCSPEDIERELREAAEAAMERAAAIRSMPKAPTPMRQETADWLRHALSPCTPKR